MCIGGGRQGWPARVGGARLTALALSSGVMHTFSNAHIHVLNIHSLYVRA